MSYYSGDFRENLRTQIGWHYNEQSIVSITNDNNDSVYIPLLLPGEVRSGEMNYMPFIEMTLVDSISKTEGVDGATKKQDCYIDLNLWYTDMNGISMTTFARKVCDHLNNLITNSRCSVASVYHSEVIGDREIPEPDMGGRSPVMHRVLSVHMRNYNTG
jgi:hypothetical protein